MIDGEVIERWFLKVLCGLVAGVGLNNATVPKEWKLVLTGEAWPDGWGLYVPFPFGSHVLATEFYLETLVNPETKAILAAKIRVAGVHFSLILGRPDNPEAWGIFRPKGLIFRNQGNEKRIGFTWPFGADEAVVYTKVGTSNEGAPQWDGWIE